MSTLPQNRTVAVTSLGKPLLFVMIQVQDRVIDLSERFVTIAFGEKGKCEELELRVH